MFEVNEMNNLGISLLQSLTDVLLPLLPYGVAIAVGLFVLSRLSRALSPSSSGISSPHISQSSFEALKGTKGNVTYSTDHQTTIQAFANKKSFTQSEYQEMINFREQAQLSQGDRQQLDFVIMYADVKK
jgi:hypothetical protein